MMKLPSEKEMRFASHAFSDASHYMFSADLLENEPGKAEFLVESAIKALKVGVANLGYELVERVTPAARDGGRMDMPDGADA